MGCRVQGLPGGPLESIVLWSCHDETKCRHVAQVTLSSELGHFDCGGSAAQSDIMGCIVATEATRTDEKPLKSVKIMKNHVRTCSEHQKSIFPTSSDFLRTFHRNARERRQARARQAGRPAVQRGPATDMPNRPRTTPAHPRVPKLGFRLFWHFLIILALPGAHPTFDCAAEPPRSK